MRILVVEDDELIAQILVEALTNQRYIVDVAADGQTGWELATTFTYDLVLLDVVLPQMDGITLCRRLRSQGMNLPILLLTAQDTHTNKVVGLDAGADDYVTKPFNLPELLARLRALLRRGSSPIPLLEWGNLCLNPSTCEVSCDRQVVPLTPKEYSLLELFLRNPLRVYSRSAILDHLWSFETVPGEETVTSHIRGLRQKLKLAGVYSDPIETVYGMGYRLKPEPQHNKESTLSKVVKLAEEVAPEPKAQATIEQQAMAEVSAVWERRKEKLSQRATVIEQAIAALLRAPLDNELRQQAQQEAHKLAGSLGMFNLDEGSRLAREIEYLIQLDSPLTQAQMLHLNELAAALSQQLQQAANQFAVAKEWERSSPALLSSNLSIAKILAVDDDPQVLVALRYLLQPWGMQLSSLNNPLRFWETISLVSPDLLILDVEMPQSSGLDLCQSLRNDPRWSSLPVLVLTAHTNAETMRQVFAVGADDFISKPIVGPELVARILNRLERSRLYQNKTQIDPLTGVANYRASAPRMLQELERAAQAGQPLCLVVITLDGLRAVNEQYGHAIAEHLLSQLGHLLQRSFRSEDIIARWGGAEFVVGLYGIAKQEGQQRLSEILNRYREVAMTDNVFKPLRKLLPLTCLSAIVEYPLEGSGLQALYQTARHQLHQTKTIVTTQLNKNDR